APGAFARERKLHAPVSSDVNKGERDMHTMTRRSVLAALAALAAGLTGPACAQGSAALGPVVFENDKVRVYHVTVKPGQDLFASEAGAPPRLAVFMTEAKVSRGGRTVEYRQGDVAWGATDSLRTENAGKKDAMVYLVEAKRSNAADGSWKRT